MPTLNSELGIIFRKTLESCIN